MDFSENTDERKLLNRCELPVRDRDSTSDQEEKEKGPSALNSAPSSVCNGDVTASVPNVSVKRDHSVVDEENFPTELHHSKLIKLKCSAGSAKNGQIELNSISFKLSDYQDCSDKMNGKEVGSQGADSSHNEVGADPVQNVSESSDIAISQTDQSVGNEIGNRNLNSEFSTSKSTDSDLDNSKNIHDTSQPSTSRTSGSTSCSSDSEVRPRKRVGKYPKFSDDDDDDDDDDDVENSDNNNSSNVRDGSNNDSESESGSSTSGLSSLVEEAGKDDFDLVSWNIGLHVPFSDDSESSGDEQNAGSSEEKVPDVLKKSLPVDTFFFPKEIMNRQFRGDDPKRKRSTRFESKVYDSRRMVQRLTLYAALEKHNGCVNAVSFNDHGNILTSASDDRRVCLWDWSRKKSLLIFDSGHVANVFQAKFLPYSGDTHLITCGQDHQIRMCLLDQSGLKSTRLIIKHDRTVHKIAMQRQMPNTFLSAGEDGVVYSIDVRESKPYCTKLLEILASRSNPNSTVCLYSIHCNPLKNYEFIVCGNDRDVRLFDQRKISPDNMSPVKTFCPSIFPTSSDTVYMRSVTCAVFNYNGTEILASYNDNDIYLFDAHTTKEVHHYDGHRNFATIKGVNFYGPRSEYVVSGSDCGYIYMWDKNSEGIVQWLKGDDNIVNCLEPHPSFPILATSGLDSDVKVWMPTSEGVTNVKDSSEFQKVAKKNHFYKYANFARYPGRSLVVRSIFDTDDFGNEMAQARLPVILSYRRALRAVRQRRQQNISSWSSSDSQDDDDNDDARSCGSLD